MKKLISVMAVAGAVTAAVLIALSGTGGSGIWVASAIVALLCCIPFFFSFEKRMPSSGELVMIAVMTAFSAAGRFIFAPIPFFKPVSSITAISGKHFGSQAGFMTGALSAVISNIWFGQGPWTPFQMLCWGGIGAAAGIAGKHGLLDKPLPLCLFGIAAGAGYSLIMDVWTVISSTGSFSVEAWLTAVTAALPVTAVYCVSNSVFLLLLNKPLGKKLERLKNRYGIFE